MRRSIFAVLCGAITAHAVPTIEAVGNKFFTSDGNQFYIHGVAYQLTSDDPLVDTAQCQRDIALMKTIGVNTIRVYHVDPTANHDGCMNAFADAGIYLFADMDTFNTAIVSDAPAWTQDQFEAFSKVMDAFHGYDNLLGLFVGNEIITDNMQSLAAPFIKSASRDMKAYRDSKGYRNFVVGYSAADIAEVRPNLQNYLTCGGNASENVDFFGLNSYQWCDPSSYTTSGYANLEALAKDFPVPFFLSETGCNQPGPRLFEDQSAIFGPNMVNDWVGAIIYEWIQEQNHFGLISYGPPVDPTVVASNVAGGFTRAGTPTPVSPDWDNLSKQWATNSPTGVARSNYNPDNVSTRPCPSSTPGGWLVDGNVPPPPLGASLGTSVLTSVPSATATTTASASGSGSSSGSGSDSGSSAGSNSGAVSGTPTNAAATPSQTKSMAAGSRTTGVAAALVGITMIFAFWL